MIRNLNQEMFQPFGTILPCIENTVQRVNHHSFLLSAGTTQLYQTVGQVWLNREKGMTVLSVSSDNEQFVDFYLDKPLLLKGGIWFRLTAMQERSFVQMAGISMPRLLQTYLNEESFVVIPKLQVTSLYTMFYQEKEQGFLFPGETHSMLELTYVDQGKLHSVAEGKDILLEQGDMVLYGPDQWHMQYADMDVAPRFVTLSFTVNGCDLSGLYNRKFQSSHKASGFLHQMLQEQTRSEAYAEDSILSLLQQLLITLLRDSSHTGEKPALSNSINSEHDIINRAQQYISTHVLDKLSVPVVAKGAEVSPSYLTALFQKHLQISPGEYIRRIKLQESKQLIREGNLNFTQIAELLQYSTVHHFSRQFKDKFGITPTEYARSVR